MKTPQSMDVAGESSSSQDRLERSLPVTYGIRMLQDIMLRGSSVPQLIFLGIASIGIVLFVIDWDS
jgi:hypothetical protein